jgi:chromosomal replication initiator protein
MNALIQPRLRRKARKNKPLFIIEHILLLKYGVTLQYACAKTNKRDVVKYRQVIQTILHRKTNMTLTEIGKAIGRMDHTSVLHSKGVISKTEDLYKSFGIKEDLFILYSEFENSYIELINKHNP